MKRQHASELFILHHNKFIFFIHTSAVFSNKVTKNIPVQKKESLTEDGCPDKQCVLPQSLPAVILAALNSYLAGFIGMLLKERGVIDQPAFSGFVAEQRELTGLKEPTRDRCRADGGHMRVQH